MQNMIITLDLFFNIFRVHFPAEHQFNALSKYIVDQTQSASLKVSPEKSLHSIKYMYTSIYGMSFNSVNILIYFIAMSTLLICINLYYSFNLLADHA